jgi:SAM-dependent methyltransferase
MGGKGISRREAEDRARQRSVVRTGYDRLAERAGTEWAAPIRRPDKAKYRRVFECGVSAGGRVLELGVGPGGGTTRRLAHRFRLIGVDLSLGQLRLAQRNVPDACFVQADMTRLEFRPGSFDGVAAFFSFIHVPASEQARLLRSVHRWLRPNGLLVCTLGSGPAASDRREDFLRVPMAWGSLGTEGGRAAVADAGFRIETSAEETELELGRPVTFLWIVARKI